MAGRVLTHRAGNWSLFSSPCFAKLQKAQLHKTGRWMKGKTVQMLTGQEKNLVLFKSPDFAKLRFCNFAKSGEARLKVAQSRHAQARSA